MGEESLYFTRYATVLSHRSQDPRGHLPENPLLPNRKLKELHALMQRTRALEQKRKPRATEPREALLAAAAIHLVPGDILSAGPSDLVAPQLAPRTKKSTAMSTPPPADLPRIAAAAGTAQGLKSAGSGSLVLALARENLIEPEWAAALQWAHTNSFPLLFVCTASMPGAQAAQERSKKAATKAATDAAMLSWSAVSSFCTRLHMPLIPTDGEDAVALYRVFQESILHARTAGSPAVIWAMFSRPPLPRSRTPLARLESYLKARKISFSA